MNPISPAFVVGFFFASSAMIVGFVAVFLQTKTGPVVVTEPYSTAKIMEPTTRLERVTC
ncbi:MAG: hypothetical protein ABIX28_09030 [Vicinamibacterales bacterium]